ncbi:hypothetical protein Tco_1234804 [Tanacetum coccineum]
MKGGGVSCPQLLIIRYGSCQVEDSVWSKRYSEWCNENSHDKKPRPRDYTFKEWVKLKKGHLDISKSVRNDLFRLWVIDQFSEALDPNKDPLERYLDEYNWCLLDEITEVQTIFNQMEEDVEQCRLETKSFEIQKKQFLIENDRLLDQIISQDIMNIVVNSSKSMNTSVNVNSSVAMNDFVHYVEKCNKCLELEAELIKQHVGTKNHFTSPLI